MWFTHKSDIDAGGLVYEWDHDRVAYRPATTVTIEGHRKNMCIPVPFEGKGDCERACELLNKEAMVPLDRGIYEWLLGKYGSIDNLRKRLVTHCCRW